LSFVARFSDPSSASQAIAHLEDIRISGLHLDDPDENGEYRVSGTVRRWELRVILDTVYRLGGRMVR
jgi:hypothetical protein